MATRQTSRTRAKDSDRTDTCQILDGALADGELSMREHRQRVAVATNAATLGEPHALVADLQTTNGLVHLAGLKKPALLAGGGWGMRAAVAAVLLALG